MESAAKGKTATHGLFGVNVAVAARERVENTGHRRSWPKYPPLRCPSRLCAALRPLARRAEDALPKPPTLEQCSNDPDIFKVETALYHVLLDELAAQKLLDSPKSSLQQRDNARRALRKVAERRHELAPRYFGKDGKRLSDSSGPADSMQSAPVDDRRWWKRNPFDSRWAKGGTPEFQKAFEAWQLRCERSGEIPSLPATGSDDFEREFHSWNSKSGFFDEIERIAVMGLDA